MDGQVSTLQCSPNPQLWVSINNMPLCQSHEIWLTKNCITALLLSLYSATVVQRNYAKF